MGRRLGESRIRRLKYHNAFPDSAGVVRHYFRRRGKRTTLRGPFGSAGFWEDYNACLADVPERAANSQKAPVARAGSFQALSQLYFASRAYKGLAASSRTNYRRVIEGFCVDHGHRLVAQFKREHCEIIIGGKADTPGAGTVLLKRIRTLIRFAIAVKWIEQDPTTGIKGYRSTEWHTWTDGELAQYEARWQPGTKQRLAYVLLLYTGQRGSDTRLMAHHDIAGDTVHVVQEKTDQRESDEKLVIPMHPALQRELALHKRKHLLILATEWGNAFSQKGFGQYVAKAIRAAKLPEICVAHGLRKAAGRRLAEAGCTAKMIQAILGHKTLAESERYTRKADQVRLARLAIDLLRTADGEVATLPKMRDVSVRD